ncbi:basic helix-loop-helix and HMG box domain-containing protein 1 [Pteropus alecto]|uniref:basic helix-loop-helix and HMG box domain-containing protein 1 n=1 Tax=Pteropus alecto TaxID=9402 RepID=UPI00076887C8|nr:basic helix-loop-helix and HMG box domain-containing protein 1 [Pteropus alecto]
MWGSSRYLCYPGWPRASSLGSSDRTLLLCSLVEGEVGISLSEPRGLREVWESDAKFHFGCPNQNQLLSQNRKQRKNHTSKLHELALLLPVGLKAGGRKLTKKEILLHVLHYIHYLQRSIAVAKALLKLHAADGKGGLGDRQTRAQHPRRCLALDKLRKQVTPCADQKGGHVGVTTIPPRCFDSCIHPKAASSPPQGDIKGERSWLALPDVAEDSIHCDLSSCYFGQRAQDDGHYPTFKAQQRAERIHFLNRTQSCPRQKLVFYESSEEADKESPDADPWLPTCTPEGGHHGSPLASGPSLNDTWSVTGHPTEILGLSPSFFSSPGKLLPEQILEDGAEYLTQDLFEEVFSDPVSSPFACVLEVPQKDTPSEVAKEPPHSHRLCRSSVSQDHCYLVLSDSSKGPSSPSSEDSHTDTDTESVWKQQQHAQADHEGPKSSSEEDEDYTWTPTRRASTLPVAGRKTRKGWTGRGPVKSKKKRTVPCSTQMKKKCVNGFIMFCRMNRKQYIRACPGTASTAATKELAQLWRTMTQQERKPYCVKARRFSRRHNRIVKQESSSSEDEDWETPKPFYQLLAEKAHCCPELASQLPPRRK